MAFRRIVCAETASKICRGFKKEASEFKLVFFGGNMKTNRIKILMMAIITIPLLAMVAFTVPNTKSFSNNVDDVEDVYKTKCGKCHKSDATGIKWFDPARTDAELVESVMKGKKFMKGFEAKGMTTEEAQALVTYMRTLEPVTDPDANSNTDG